MGSTSNVNATNPYNLYGSSAGKSYYDLGGTSNAPQQGFYRSNIGNPKTTWEGDIITNVGFDAVILNNKVDITLRAYTYLRKPVEREDLAASLQQIRAFLERSRKHLLLVEDDADDRAALRELLGGEDVAISEAATGEEAVRLLKEQPADCLVLDLGLPDTSGLELLARIRREVGLLQLPVIVHTGRELTPEEEEELDRVTSAVVIKDALSPERLLQETALFLHRGAAGLDPSRRRPADAAAAKEPILQGKTVLIVDDDMRNIYALTTVLEDLDVRVLHAQNGRRAIEVLESTAGIDIVFMDIMMPEMDGYQASREIRKRERFRGLPIIALTAKAMKGDRERCIEAGASDYIPKPVDTERLLSLLRVWLYTED